MSYGRDSDAFITFLILLKKSDNHLIWMQYTETVLAHSAVLMARPQLKCSILVSKSTHLLNKIYQFCFLIRIKPSKYYSSRNFVRYSFNFWDREAVHVHSLVQGAIVNADSRVLIVFLDFHQQNISRTVDRLYDFFFQHIFDPFLYQLVVVRGNLSYMKWYWTVAT